MQRLKVIYSPGMSGEQFIDRIGLRALKAEGVEVVTHHWTRFINPLRNLRNRAQHGRAAEALASLVAEERRRESGRLIVLMGHSTGCLVTLEALERLGEPVDQAVLLAAAVRPDYDLRAALGGTRRLVSFHSPLDLLFLVAGTSVCGTADGSYGAAAGWGGFRGPGSGDPAVMQVGYEPAWARMLHLGGHVGCFAPAFMRTVVLRRVLQNFAAGTRFDEATP